MTHPLQKILHIDDDPVMRLMTQKALERSNIDFQIVSCTTPEDFLGHLEAFHPDLLLVDQMMPAIRGEDLVQEVRKKPGGENIPVIFITGSTEISSLNATMLEPMIGVIRKPFSPTQLPSELIRMWADYRVDKA